MKTIILPGYSPYNREWAYEVKENLKLDGDVIVQEWVHWSDASSSFSVKKETEKILGIIGNTKVNIIAKSVGTRVLMNLAPLLHGKVNKVILCGIPTKGISETAVKTYSEGFKHLKTERTIIFQNTKDPLANYSEISKFIGSISKGVKIVEKPRSDHHYPYYEEFQKYLL